MCLTCCLLSGGSRREGSANEVVHHRRPADRSEFPALPANMVQYRDSQDNMVMGYSLLLYSQDSVDS